MDTVTAQFNARMLEIFNLVCPAEEAKRLAAAGVFSADDVAQVSWKGPIAALVTDEELLAADVTVSELADAVQYMTATRATCERIQIGQRICEDYHVEATRPGWLITADGYAAGPAGDG